MNNIQREVKKYTLLSAGKVVAIASSTNASPIEITTSGAHGLSTGDKVTINGHTTNTSANGSWTIIKVDATKFTLTDSVGVGIGGASGCVANFVDPINVLDFRHMIVAISSDGGGTATATIKCVGSINETVPDFAAARSVANNFEFIQMIDKQDGGTGLAGDTGVVFAGADNYLQYEINVNGLKWLSFLPTAGSAGQFTIKLMALKP